MNFKYEPEKAKEGLSFAVKEKQDNHMLRKVLVPVLCSVSGLGIALTSYFVVRSSSQNKDMAQEKSYNTLSKLDGDTNNYTYSFTVEGKNLDFRYHPNDHLLTVDFSSSLTVDGLTVKDEDEKLDYDSVDLGYRLSAKSTHNISWDYDDGTLKGEGSFLIEISRSAATQKDRKA